MSAAFARPPRRAPIIVVALAALTPALRAQRSVVTLDAGAASVRYADSLGISATTVTPALSVEWPSATLGASGTLTRTTAGVESLQGELGGSLFSPATSVLGGARLELAGSAGGSAHQDGTRTGELLGELKAHVMRDRWGVWGGGGGGNVWDGALWRPVLLGDAGAWVRSPTTMLIASATPTRVDDTLRYTDGQLAVRWMSPRLELDGAVGARWGRGVVLQGSSARAWGSAAAVVWVHPAVGIVVSGGSYPVDFVQGYPGGRFASIAIRLRSPGRAASRARASLPGGAARDDASSPDDAGAAPGGVVSFAVGAASGTTRTIRVRAPRAARVEIAGDFTDWALVSLAPAGDGWWTASLEIPAGIHQVNLRVDGTTWVVPPGLASIDDESGSSGLLVIR